MDSMFGMEGIETVSVKGGEAYEKLNLALGGGVKTEVQALDNSKKDKTVSVYTSGSWDKSKDNKPFYTGGFLVIRDGDIVMRDSVYEDDNNYVGLRGIAGEILAIRKALIFINKVMPRMENINIFSNTISMAEWAMSDLEDIDNLYIRSFSKFVKDNQEKRNISMYLADINDKYSEEARALTKYANALGKTNGLYNKEVFARNYTTIR